MILRALCDYYDYLVANKSEDIVPIGYQTVLVNGTFEIDSEGRLTRIVTYDEPRHQTVPARKKASSGIVPSFLFGKSDYLIGLSKNDSKKDIKRAIDCFIAMRTYHTNILSDIVKRNQCANAIVRFFNATPDELLKNEAVRRNIETLEHRGTYVLSVRIDGKIVNPMNDIEIRKAWETYRKDTIEHMEKAICLVYGNNVPIAITHPVIKGINGAQPSGASLVAFNFPAGESYGRVKAQGMNAPVSMLAADKYTAALNYLLSQPNHHVTIGNLTIMYWSLSAMDDNESDIIHIGLTGIEIQSDHQQRTQYTLDQIMHKLAKAEKLQSQANTFDDEFYILGLKPNSSRLSVQFFFHDSFGSFLNNIEKHYKRTNIIHNDRFQEKLSPYDMLAHISVPNANKNGNVMSNKIASSLIKSILLDVPYPNMLYFQCIQRIARTQHNHDRKVTYRQAAIIKMYLIRNANMGGIRMSLNPNEKSTGYLLGRTFAIIEKMQSDVNGRKTISATWGNSASMTPATSFPVLLRKANEYLSQMSEPARIYYSKQLSELMSDIGDFPKRLDMTGQGQYWLGYYQQREELYKKRSEKFDDSSTSGNKE